MKGVKGTQKGPAPQMITVFIFEVDGSPERSFFPFNSFKKCWKVINIFVVDLLLPRFGKTTSPILMGYKLTLEPMWKE
jgi:hypothetical protein